MEHLLSRSAPYCSSTQKEADFFLSLSDTHSHSHSLSLSFSSSDQSRVTDGDQTMIVFSSRRHKMVKSSKIARFSLFNFFLPRLEINLNLIFPFFRWDLPILLSGCEIPPDYAPPFKWTVSSQTELNPRFWRPTAIQIDSINQRQISIEGCRVAISRAKWVSPFLWQ